MISDHADLQAKEVLGANPAFTGFVEDEKLREMLNSIAIKEALPPASVQPMDQLRSLLKGGLAPQVLIVDFTRAADIIKEAKALLKEAPDNTRIIIVGNDDHIATFRELKRLGVTDYLTRPLEEKTLQDAIIDAMHMPARVKNNDARTKPLTVIMSARGGCGASTLAVNLAWLTANDFKKKVCLVDMDLYNGSICVLLDLPQNSGFNDALGETERLDETFLKRLILQKEDNLFVLAGQTKLGQDFAFNAEALMKLFNLLRDRYDYIYVDLSTAYQSPMSQAILGMADRAIIVTDLSLVSIQGVLRLKSYLGTYFANLKYKVIANNIFPQGGTVSKSMFEKGIDSTIDDTLPYCKGYMLEGINAGEPFAKTKHEHAYSRQLLNFLKLLYPQLNTATVKKSFFQKWWSKKDK